jgi:outer membrane protein assembly factor BamB
VCEVPDAGPRDAAVDASPDTPPDAAPVGTTATSIGIDPAHDNAQPTDVVASPLSPVWTATFNGPVSYPLVAHDAVFVSSAGASPTVRALDISTGATLWGPITMPGRVTLAYDADRVFALEFDGHLIALDAATGSQLWSIQVPGQPHYYAPPVASDGSVYVNGVGVGGTLLAIDEQYGVVRWTHGTGGSRGGVAVADGVVYVGEACDALALDEVTGAVDWSRSYNCTGGGGWAPSVHATKIWNRNPSQGSEVLDHGGTLLGTFQALAIPAFHDGVAFYRTLGAVSAVDIATATLRWRFTGDGNVCTSPVIAGAGGQVFIASSSGKVYELDEVTGAQRSVHDVGTAITCFDETSSISLADGHLLVPAGNELVVY